MLLTKLEGETFTNQVVYISGQAFVRCKFVGCTLVLRQEPYHLEGCVFDRCNWHVDRILIWGNPEALQEFKALISLIEQGQAQLNETEAQVRAMSTSGTSVDAAKS